MLRRKPLEMQPEPCLLQLLSAVCKLTLRAHVTFEASELPASRRLNSVFSPVSAWKLLYQRSFQTLDLSSLQPDPL